MDPIDTYTDHSSRRASQRNLSTQEIDYVRHYGQVFHKAGALIYFLRRKDIPAWDQVDDRWMRLAGTALILTKDGRTLITAWRNRRTGLKQIKRKPDYDRRPYERYTGDWRLDRRELDD